MDEAQLQELVDDALARSGAIGAAVAVLHRGEISEAAAGFANVATGLPATTDTLFQVGSTTKVHNAALVLSLVEQGEVDLDVPVSTYIGDVWQLDATLRQLLSHTGGIEGGPKADLGDGAGSLERFIIESSVRDRLAEPGEVFSYSNIGISVTGYVVERVLDQVWDEALRERVLEPAGLERSATLLKELVYHPIAVGHHAPADDGSVDLIRPFSYGRCRAPAGSTLCTSAGDLVRFAALFLSEGRSLAGTTVLDPSSIDAMQTPQVDVPARGIAERWCVGPFSNDLDGHVSWGHAGGNLGGGSYLFWVPDLDLAVATVCNTPALMRRFDAIVHEAVLGSFGLHLPEPEVPHPMPDLDLDALAGTYGTTDAKVGFVAAGDRLTIDAPGFEGLELLPLDERRFRHPQGTVWDTIAFLGDDGGRPTHVLVKAVNGLRRLA